MPIDPSSPALAKLGQLGSALALFLCGYLAFRTDDWRLALLFSLLAIGAGLLSTRFAGAARR